MRAVSKPNRYRGRLRGYIGSLDELAIGLGVDLEEARIVRLSVTEQYLNGDELMLILDEMGQRGYNIGAIEKEYRRIYEIGVSIGATSVNKGVFGELVRSRVMGVGGIMGEVGKDEIVSILSGILLDSRVDLNNKLSAIDLIGKYRNYYKGEDRDVHIIIEGGKSEYTGGIPEAIEVHGGDIEKS